MVLGIITAIGSLLALLLAVWNWFMRKHSEERRLADEAQKMLDEGIEANDTSLITAAFARMRRLCKR